MMNGMEKINFNIPMDDFPITYENNNMPHRLLIVKDIYITTKHEPFSGDEGIIEELDIPKNDLEFDTSEDTMLDRHVLEIEDQVNHLVRNAKIMFDFGRRCSQNETTPTTTLTTTTTTETTTTDTTTETTTTISTTISTTITTTETTTTDTTTEPISTGSH